MGLTEIAINMISTLGYAGLFIGLMVDSMGVPIPPEVLVPLSAVLAKQGQFNLVAVIIIATTAQVTGAIIAYEIGRRGGITLIRRYGYYVLLSEHDLSIAHRWFERYGKGLALVGRCLPVIRGYIAYVAGIGEMQRSQFIVYTAIGSLLWASVLSVVGWQLADHIKEIDQAIKPFTFLIVLAIIGIIVWFVASRWSQRAALKAAALKARAK